MVMAGLALMLQATAVMAYPTGVVLCIAEDGHVSVETAHETVRCTADWARHHPDAASAADLDGHPCTDTFVSQSAARSGQVVTVGAASCVVLAVTVGASRPTSWGRNAVGRCVAPPGRLAALRSVVLQA